MSGGTGPVLVWNNFQWTANSQVMDFFMGNFYNMSGVLSGMVSGAQPIM